MIAIIGKHSNDLHPDSDEIGYRNWQCYEIEKNYEKGNGLVVVQIDESCTIPNVCYGKEAEFMDGFKKDRIKEALEKLAE